MADTLPPRIRSRERLRYIRLSDDGDGFRVTVQLDGGGATTYIPQGATLAHVTGRLGELVSILEESANKRHDESESDE